LAKSHEFHAKIHKLPIAFNKLILYNDIVNKLIRGIWVFLLLALALSLGSVPTTAQVEGQRYFQETGHWVIGDFYTAYMAVPDPEAIFGYPITDAWKDQTTQQYVQYFERAQFRLRPDQPPELRVDMTRLGEIAYDFDQHGTPLSIPANFPACKTFDETGHQVCYAFLTYFEQNGGVALFGYPISDIEIRNNRIVQYFQRSVFEWHPELASGERVVLSDLGRQYFFIKKEDPSRLLSNKDSYSLQTILGLKVHAFPTKAVVKGQTTQTIYAIVLDQKLLPLPNAQVIATIRYPSGKEERIVMPLTDANGISKLNRSVNENQKGIVEVQISASYNSLQQDTRTSFRIWW
jgi:hypothetical protein